MEVVKEDEIKEEINLHALRCNDFVMEDITTDVENIQVECKKINCNPVINTFKAIYKLFCHLMKCFKFKNE